MNFIKRSITLITQPRQAWAQINAEEEGLGHCMAAFVLPLALAGALASFAGYGLIGVDTGILNIHIREFNWGFYAGIKHFICCITCTLLTADACNRMAVFFESGKNMDQSGRLIAYSFTPGFIGGLFNILPMFGFISMISWLYGFYLLYLGLPVIKKTPLHRQAAYFLSCCIAASIIYAVVNLVSGFILGNVFDIDITGRYGRFGV